MIRKYAPELALFACFLILLIAAHPVRADDCLPFRKLITGHAQAQYGLSAPVPMFAAQIQQESSCRPGIVSWDNGQGLAQFTGSTIDFAGKLFPDLGEPAPLNPIWAIPAMLRYDAWLKKQLQAATECDGWAAALKAYNAGAGYVKRAQAASTEPGVWFGQTEFVQTGQSAKNFEYSRMYPRKILIDRQPKFAIWGMMVCKEEMPI